MDPISNLHAINLVQWACIIILAIAVINLYRRGRK